MNAGWIRATLLALLAAVAATLVVLAPAGAAPNKPYSIVICGNGQTGCTSANPAVIAPGGTTGNPSSLSVTFTNDNKLGSGIQLGSDNLNVPSTPAGFSVIAASTIVTPTPTSPPQALVQCPASFNNQAPPCFVLLNGDATIGFRNLNLAPGQSAMITMSAATPQPSTTACTTASPCLWTDEAKQSNDFSGTGNDLNSDSNSSYGTVMSAVASCPRKQPCSTTLANGGTATSAPGSISTTVKTSSGKTPANQLESIDFGPPIADDLPAPTPICSGVTSPHLTYENLSNGAGRSQTYTINTTDFAGYESEACFETQAQFTQLVCPAEASPDSEQDPEEQPDCVTGATLAPANPVTLPDGTAGCSSAQGCPAFVGLLPDCSNPPPVGVPAALQVDCTKTPGVSLRQTSPDGKTHTLVIAVPAGYDPRYSN